MHGADSTPRATTFRSRGAPRKSSPSDRVCACVLRLPAIGALLLSSGGCVAPPGRVVGYSVQGRPIEHDVIGRGRQTVLILATIHGDEAAGTPLVQRLEQHLLRHPDLLRGRRVVLVPLANPDGYAEHTRGNAHGVDLNRNFPAGNFRGSRAHGDAPLSEPESRALFELLDRYRPARVVSIHQPLTCIDYDGPAEGLAAVMGEWCDLPVRRIGSRPGSLGSHVGLTRGVPIITLELPEEATGMNAEELWDTYGNVLLAAIRYPEKL